MTSFDVDPVTWALLNRLLDEALDLAPDDRQRWLDQLPPEHRSLRPRLEELLSHATENGKKARFTTLPKLDEPSALHEAGADVGPYRLLRLLGEGGMGAVWLAERIDGMLRRQVALKLPRAFELRPELSERMARERDILAALAHPNIAHLYDAGITQTGQPYLALEYVEGEPIDRYVQARKLEIRERLKLFLQVTRAIAYAHGRLVVHRDIKPANILVTTNGEVRLLDFGIAKLLDKGRTEETELTRESGRPLTVAYASPEQIRGETLSVGSDIYSLGVVLYELASGARAYRPARDSAAALEEAVLNADPVRPSDAADASVRRTLRGDLDTIILKAMKKDPRHRYATVDSFADDLERHLHGHPVLARADSATYRMRKFVGRHRLAVAAAAIVFASIFAGAGVAVWQAQVALAEKARAEEVKSFIASIFKDANVDTGSGKPLSAVELLVQAKERMDRSLTRPDIRVELLRLIGESLVSLHDSSSTEGVLKQAVEEATALYGADHIITLRTRQTCCWAMLLQGRLEDMEKELALLLPLLERHPEVNAEDMAQHHRLEAYGAFQRGAFAEAAQDAARSYELAEKGLPKDSPEKLQILAQLAEAYSFDNQHELAQKTIEQAEKLASEIFPQNTTHPHVVFMREIHAVVLGRSGDTDAALDQLARLVADRAAVHGPDAITVGHLYNNMVSYQLQSGRIADALHASERALAILSKHGTPESYSVAAAVNARAKSLLRARKGKEALELSPQVRDFAVKTFGASHPNAIASRAAHALVLGYVGRFDEALAENQSVLDDLRKSGAPLPVPFFIDGQIRRFSGDRTGARKILEEGLSKTNDKPGGWLDRANVLVALGVVQLESGELAQAAASVEPSLASFELHRKQIAPDHADALVALGRVRMAQGRAADALTLLERADEFWRSFDAGSRWAEEASSLLAQCRREAKR